MNADQTLERVARSLLYEGYILYPYRRSLKNTQRWTFGALFPRASSLVVAGNERSTLGAECLLEAPDDAALECRARFLHLTDRRVVDASENLLDALEIDERLFQSWQEAIEREARFQAPIDDLLARPARFEFAFPASAEREALIDSAGTIRGHLIRERRPVSGAVALSLAQLGPARYRLSLSLSNETPDLPGARSRDGLAIVSLASAHVALRLAAGGFVSLTDPPVAWQSDAAACRQTGCWPVLVGDPTARDTILCSPIILSDFPQVAEESPGDWFDCAEIDEMLALRIMTLTDGEKREMQSLDPRLERLLAETGQFDAGRQMALHGTRRAGAKS